MERSTTLAADFLPSKAAGLKAERSRATEAGARAHRGFQASTVEGMATAFTVAIIRYRKGRAPIGGSVPDRSHGLPAAAVIRGVSAGGRGESVISGRGQAPAPRSEERTATYLHGGGRRGSMAEARQNGADIARAPRVARVAALTPVFNPIRARAGV